jgi:uncharacterized protein
MTQWFWLVPLGFGVGAYGTLIGAGGGFVLIPLLLLVYPQEGADTLAATSLAVVFFNALSGSAAYARMKRIDYRAALLFAGAGVPGAILGASATAWIPRRIFSDIIGVLLIAGAVFLMLRANGRDATGHIAAGHASQDGLAPPPYRTPRKLALGMLLSVFVGFVSSLLGIGGGIIHVPVLVYVLGFPMHMATATSHLILAIIALVGSGVHLADGTLSQNVGRTAALAVGVVGGAQVGAYLSAHVASRWILRGLAVGLLLVGGRVLMLAL